MSFWSKLGGFLVGGPVGLGLAAQADSLKDSLKGYDPNADYYAGAPDLPTDVTSGVRRDTSGLDRYRSEAMRSGPSHWANLAMEQQGQNADTARQRGMAEVGSQRAMAEDQLASGGGLTSGARERLATTSARNALDMSQQVGKEQAANNLQIGINDEQNRISQLGALPGMDLAAASFDLSKAGSQNAFNAQNYQTKAGIWAAGKQAQAEDPRNPASPNYDDGKRWYNPFSW